MGDFYDQPLGKTPAAARWRGFSHFFDKLPLCFSERVEVMSLVANQSVTLALRGPWTRTRPTWPLLGHS